ncbi:scm-like with four MBT domains protein 2 [Trichogramma pretiosum]|uniref:scm-like with four MBT domains protein 2 n=1 Tax=Trichogramma pretiosum TaxID=7493 RepID=UPI0006C96098|nr:scm-like with four MBT domains protein 2 [Trichogramma pretiosum]
MDIENMNAFCWPNYLENTNTEEVPQIVFNHVEETLKVCIEVGMSLEIPVKTSEPEPNHLAEECFWPATISMVCGPLLRLRYFGGEERALEVWLDLTKENAHELGWATKNNKKLKPPEIVLQRTPDCLEKLDQFMQTAISVPYDMLFGDQLSIVDKLKPGMKIEISDHLDPYRLWRAIIKENVGGRLSLSYVTPKENNVHFWRFCTDEFLFSLSPKTEPYYFKPPHSLKDTYKWDNCETDLLNEKPIDSEIDNTLQNNRVEHPDHEFKVGMKLETLYPKNRKDFCPGTVIKVFCNKFFLVRIDDHMDDTKLDCDSLYYKYTNRENSWICSADHPYIFPAGWAAKNGFNLKAPDDWSSTSNGLDFNWESYSKFCDFTVADEKLFSEHESAADAGFECKMRLEAVDPRNQNIICAAHITKIVENLVWIKIDAYSDDYGEHIVDMHSQEIFPIGWCETNHYPLKPPRDYQPMQNALVNKSADPFIDVPLAGNESMWCPKIYFNYRCSTGPLLSKSRIAKLPQSVGPGPTTLVLKEVLTMIISIGYKNSRIIKILQTETYPAEMEFSMETLKVKNVDGTNNHIRASIPIITSGEMVAQFCQQICKRLSTCPYLMGPFCVEDVMCPLQCNPPRYKAGAKNGENGEKQRPWGKRGRRRGRKPYKLKAQAAAKVETDEIKTEIVDPQINENAETQNKELVQSYISDNSCSTDDNTGSNSSLANSSLSANSSKGSSKKRKNEEMEADPEDYKCPEKIIKLDSNPLYWSFEELAQYLSTTQCSDLAATFIEEEVDGFAFIMLNYPTLIEHMKLNTETAHEVCKHIKSVRESWYMYYKDVSNPDFVRVIEGC